MHFIMAIYDNLQLNIFLALKCSRLVGSMNVEPMNGQRFRPIIELASAIAFRSFISSEMAKTNLQSSKFIFSTLILEWPKSSF